MSPRESDCWATIWARTLALSVPDSRPQDCTIVRNVTSLFRCGLAASIFIAALKKGWFVANPHWM